MDNQTENDTVLQTSLIPSEDFDASLAAENTGVSSLPAFVRAALLEKANKVNNTSVRGEACSHD